MKFGKQLFEVVAKSDPEWAPFFINYKLLKQKIKMIRVLRAGSADLTSEPASTAGGEARASTHTPSPDNQSATPATDSSTGAADGSSSSDIGESKAATPAAPRQTPARVPAAGSASAEQVAQGLGEREFFRCLHMELRKSADFFTSVEKEMALRHARLKEAVRTMQHQANATENHLNQSMSACLQFYKDLLMLENFSIMNFCGFSKILKKHDKNTGFVTREQFMKRMVRRQPFANYPTVQKMINELEQLFQEIATKRDGGSGTAGTSPPSLRNEERLFIDAILEMRSQAQMMCASEHDEEGAAAGVGAGAASGAESGETSPSVGVPTPPQGSNNDLGAAPPPAMDLAAASAGDAMDTTPATGLGPSADSFESTRALHTAGRGVKRPRGEASGVEEVIKVAVPDAGVPVPLQMRGSPAAMSVAARAVVAAALISGSNSPSRIGRGAKMPKTVQEAARARPVAFLL